MTPGEESPEPDVLTESVYTNETSPLAEWVQNHDEYYVPTFRFQNEEQSLASIGETRFILDEVNETYNAIWRPHAVHDDTTLLVVRESLDERMTLRDKIRANRFMNDAVHAVDHTSGWCVSKKHDDYFTADDLHELHDNGVTRNEFIRRVALRRLLRRDDPVLSEIPASQENKQAQAPDPQETSPTSSSSGESESSESSQTSLVS